MKKDYSKLHLVDMFYTEVIAELTQTTGESCGLKRITNPNTLFLKLLKQPKKRDKKNQKESSHWELLTIHDWMLIRIKVASHGSAILE